MKREHIAKSSSKKTLDSKSKRRKVAELPQYERQVIDRTTRRHLASLQQGTKKFLSSTAVPEDSEIETQVDAVVVVRVRRKTSDYYLTHNNN